MKKITKLITVAIDDAISAARITLTIFSVVRVDACCAIDSDLDCIINIY